MRRMQSPEAGKTTFAEEASYVETIENFNLASFTSRQPSTASKLDVKLEAIATKLAQQEQEVQHLTEGAQEVRLGRFAH